MQKVVLQANTDHIIQNDWVRMNSTPQCTIVRKSSFVRVHAEKRVCLSCQTSLWHYDCAVISHTWISTYPSVSLLSLELFQLDLSLKVCFISCLFFLLYRWLDHLF